MSLGSRVHYLRGHHNGGVAVPLLILGSLILCGMDVLFSASAGAQSTISVTTDLVVLPVSVTDSKGSFVSGLRSENFHVVEDGRPQKVTLFTEEDNPVTVGLVVDRSRSMQPKLRGVAAAAFAFAHSSNPEDEMFVVDFSDGVSIERIGGKEFTSDAKELEQAVARVPASGQTALYDAILKGLDHLRLGRRDKKALVIVSDGGDNASGHKFADVLDLARRSHAVIYAIGLVGESNEEENPRILEKLCRETGGIAFFPRPDESVADISQKIARDLREQYTLGYAPGKKDKSEAFRKIAVEVSAPGLGKVRVRTRTGYFPGPKTESPAQPRRSAPSVP